MACIIVKRGDFQTFDLLHAAFAARVPVIWDRRQPVSRLDRRATEAPETERRTGPPPASWSALNFVVVDRYM